MLVTFRAQKMIDRVKKEGREDLLDEETLKTIKMLDGKQANDHNWQSVVMHEPLAWIEADEDQDGMYVALCDCE